MEFPYTERECDVGIVHVPTLPITLNGFPVGHALVDTGADVTLLPMEINQVLGLELSDDRAIEFESAGGGTFRAVPGTEPVTYGIEQSGFRPLQWRGTAFFVANHPTVLLGQHQCLSELILRLDAPSRTLTVQQENRRM